MKQLFPLLICAFLFSCGQGNNKRTTTTKDTVTHTIDIKKTDSASYNEQLVVYQIFTNDLDTTDVVTATVAAVKYKELFSTNDTLINDRAYVIFERFYSKLMFGLNDHLSHEIDGNINYDKFRIDDENTYPPALRDLNKQLKSNGFRFIEVEGAPAISQDRIFLIKWFYPSVSVTMRKYLDEVNKENAEGFEDDGGLTITVTLLSDRTVWWEQFATDHPNFIFAHEVLFQEQIYLTYLLRGIDNSPVVDYETKTIDKDYKDAYDHLLAKYPGSKTAKLVKPYYEALLSKNTAETGRLIAQYQSQKLLAW